LFSSTIHGWKVKDWREKCIGKAKTLTFFKSKVGNVSCGYLDIPWLSDGGSTKDGNAFVVSINHQRKLTHDKTKNVTYFNNNYGP